RRVLFRSRLRQYIHTVAGRYAGKVQAWDVVNEQIGEDGQYRDTSWVRAYGGDGDALMRDAFRFAAEAAPGTALYYNDFNAWRPEKVAGKIGRAHAELQSRENLVCRLLLEKKKQYKTENTAT